MRLARYALLLLVAGSAACSSHRGQPPTPPPAPIQSSYTVERDLIYSPVNWPEVLKADLYLPDTRERRPAVLLIHGGGWAAPDRREQMAGIAQRIAARGYVVMNATYRFAPQYHWPAQRQDLQEALKWLHANAGEYRVQADHIGAFGYSAGAHLAAMLGALGDTPQTRVQAVVAGGTPTDLRKYQGGSLVPQFLGGSQAQIPKQFADASPVTHIKKGDPPVFLYHGGLDTLVSVDHAEDYQKALDAAGVPNELYILRGRGHITAFFSDEGAVDAALAFLDRYLR